jgi:membrane protease YdiL (CAAX protease family)
MAETVAPPSRYWRFVQHPAMRLGLGIVWVLLVVVLVQVVISLVIPLTDPALNLLGGVVVAAAALAAYITFVRVVERRPVAELAPARAPLELGLGLLAGALLFAATIGFISMLGYYHIESFNSWVVALPALADSIVAGVFEEILFRGLLFRITQESLGTWLALAISAVVFGLLHLANPNATLLAGLAIALEAGVMLAAAYLLTGRLWLSMGIHFAWNFTQGGIFGAAVSGQSSTGIFASTLQGPTLLTGGAFGAEASVVAMVVCGVFGFWLVLRAWQAGKIVRPLWQRAGK